MDIPQVPNFVFAPSRASNMSDNNNNNQGQAEERNVRQRRVSGYGLVPYDDSVRIPNTMVEVDIQNMMEDKPERKRAIMYLQLIRVVSGSNGQNNMSTYQSYFKKNKNNGPQASHYFRLLLFRDVTSSDGHVVYMVEGKRMNDQLWSKFPLLRDNGVVTIGSYISVMNPNPITTMFCNEIPLIECHWGCIVMKDPDVMVEVPVDTSIEQNCTRCFLRNKVQIDVVATTIHTTQCSGLFCDKQRSVEILRGQRACGCYHMNNRVG